MIIQKLSFFIIKVKLNPSKKRFFSFTILSIYYSKVGFQDFKL